MTMKRLIFALAMLAWGTGDLLAQKIGDATAIPSLRPQVQAFGMLYNGTTFDLMRGDTAGGIWQNVKSWGSSAVVTGGVAGSVGVGGTEANNVAPAANPLRLAGFSWTDGTAPTPTTAGRVTDLLTTTDHRLVVTSDHPKRVLCRLTTAATTSTLITGCSAPGAGLSIYITDISIMGGVALAITASAQIQYGTGGTCGTPTVVYDCQHGATAGCVMDLNTPIKAVANSEVCLLDATVGTKFVTLTGYIAP